MTGEPARQICGNCGAPNDANAIVCEVCGALLAAYASPPATETSQPTETTSTPTTTTTPAPARPTTAAPTTPAPSSSGDWRTMFESKPGSRTSSGTTLPNLERDFHNDLPQTAATPNQAIPRERRPTPERAARPEPEPAPIPQDVPRQPNWRRQQTSAKPAKPAKARPAAPARPGLNPRFNQRRPHTFIVVGLFLLFLGCFITVILASVDAGDLLVGLVFLCSISIGFILLVMGAVISISRREGRGG